MFKFLLPRADEDFFQLFQTIVTELLQATEQFQLFIQTLDVPEQYDRYFELFHQHEKQADIITNTCLQKLHKNFITPFDRDEIHRFIINVNDVIEAVLRTAERIDVYQIKNATVELKMMADLVSKAGQLIHKASIQLNNLANATAILEYCNQMNQIESEAEKTLLIGVAKLFQEETDIKRLLKIKEIIEYTKSIIDTSQTIANIIKDIVLEYS